MFNLFSLFDVWKESSISLQYRYALLLEKCDTGTRPSEKVCVDTSWRQAGAALWSCKNLVRVGGTETSTDRHTDNQASCSLGTKLSASCFNCS